MIQAVLTDNVDHPRIAAPGVVDVGQAVAQARAQVQQGGRHAVVPVSGTGHHTLEETKHAAHAGSAVQRRDKVHLRCPGVGKADIDVSRQQRMDHRFRTVH